MTYYIVEFYKERRKVRSVNIDSLTTALSFAKFMIEIGNTIRIITITEVDK